MHEIHQGNDQKWMFSKALNSLKFLYIYHTMSRRMCVYVCVCSSRDFSLTLWLEPALILHLRSVKTRRRLSDHTECVKDSKRAYMTVPGRRLWWISDKSTRVPWFHRRAVFWYRPLYQRPAAFEGVRRVTAWMCTCVSVCASYLIKCTDEEKQSERKETDQMTDIDSTDSDPKPHTDLYSVFLYISTHNSSQDELLSGNEPNKCIWCYSVGKRWPLTEPIDCCSSKLTQDSHSRTLELPPSVTRSHTISVRLFY